MNDTTLNFNQEYRLNLEPYMDEDVVEFEITALAIDTAQPQPLTGVSNPILIRAASAYGRYRATLSTLGKIRSKIDGADDVQNKLDPEVAQLADEAARQAETSPFFDTLDRMNLAKIIGDIHDALQSPAKDRAAMLIDISTNLGDFLFEHETLDDRERDRDFFIAVRTFSRILEMPRASRPVAIENLEARIKTFLDQRHLRWRKRVERLGGQVKLALWPRIRDTKPFPAGIEEAGKLDVQNKQIDAQTVIVKTTNLYKTWIDELEAREDEYKQKREQEQQQGLTNARNELRELQQRQDQVSSNLDRASSRSQEDLDTKWQSSRPIQNSNIKQATGLLDQLRAMSPNAGDRLKAAISAMEETLGQGQAGNYTGAESATDIAGRLLRDAEQSAARSQQKQRDRGRRKRTSGDDYFGNTVAGGDVETKTDYQVDPRYREEILRDANQSGESNADKALLDNYLRQILR